MSSRTLEEVFNDYTSKFGGVPIYLLMGLSDEKMTDVLEKSLKENKPIKAKTTGDRVY